MYKYTLATVACSALALASGCGDSSAEDIGNAIRGEQLADQKCVTCHHPSGDSTKEGVPRIAGQNASYLTNQLFILREGIRPSEVMNKVAKDLTNQQIADLVAYWSSAKPAGSVWGGQDAARVAQGEKLFNEGDVDNRLIACAVCHGDRGQGVADLVIPRIMGQAPGYLESMLAEFAVVPDFGDAKPNAMHIIARTAVEAGGDAPESYVDAVVSYVSSQPWGSAP